MSVSIKESKSAKEAFREKWNEFKNEDRNGCYFDEKIWKGIYGKNSHKGIIRMREVVEAKKQEILAAISHKHPQAIQKIMLETGSEAYIILNPSLTEKFRGIFLATKKALAKGLLRKKTPRLDVVYKKHKKAS